MKSLESVLKDVEASRQDMIDAMIGMIRIPALAPINGGRGESEKADHLIGLLDGFDSIRRIDVPDETDPSVLRSNILAKKDGKRKGTVWIIAHMDVVPAGDPDRWDTPPFEPVHRDGKVFGRGTEDNGQAIISSLFAAKALLGEELEGRSMGVAYVADEETSSRMGIIHLLDLGIFTEDDVIIVPDWGSPGGSMVEVAEKNLLWLKFEIEGKTTHGSTPDLGINAYRVSTVLLMDLMDRLPGRFPSEDPVFSPPGSTFEPTMRPATVENVNTIPGHDEFTMDMRLLPCYRIDDVIDFCRDIAAEHEAATGARIKVVEVMRHQAGAPSSTESEGFGALSAAVESVVGTAPKAVGVGGGTCANFFRERGLDAYVWQCGGGSLHAPNEHVVVDNLMTDAKVFATLYHMLCTRRAGIIPRTCARSSTRC